MKYLAATLALVLAGCAANPETVNSVAANEVAQMRQTTRPLSTFAGYELRPMVISDAVQRDDAKVAQANVLEQKLQEQILPLLQQWKTSPAADRSGTLVIEPQLASLRIVSGGARFFAGAWAGTSTIDLYLRLSDEDTSAVIARSRIDLQSNAIAGGWSIGATDRNLLEYIAATAKRYLEHNY